VQYKTWNIAGSLAYVQSKRLDFNPHDINQAQYPLSIEFLGLLVVLHLFVDIFVQCFSHLLILNDKRYSFRANPSVYVEVDVKKKPPQHIFVFTT
jgi:hypothetical protein